MPTKRAATKGKAATGAKPAAKKTRAPAKHLARDSDRATAADLARRYREGGITGDALATALDLFAQIGTWDRPAVRTEAGAFLTVADFAARERREKMIAEFARQRSAGVRADDAIDSIARTFDVREQTVRDAVYKRTRRKRT